MKNRIASLAAMALLSLLGPVSARADVVVASNLPGGATLSSYDINIGYSGTGFSNEAAAQEFKAGAGGLVTTVVATLDAFQPGTTPLDVSIYSAAGSVPGTLLGSALFTPSQVSSNAFVAPSTFDLTSANIALVAGQSYFVTFTVATPVGGTAAYRAILENSNANFFGFQPLYSTNGGATYTPEGIPNEIGLTISARTVPEPSTLALTGLGAVALLSARARGRSGRLRSRP